jgi:SAM-dependent methyltransferase
MSQTSSKAFGPIRDAYTFFQQHATEAEEDIRAYLPHIQGMARQDHLLRMLDFGCGDGVFSAALLERAHIPAARLQLTLVEPDEVYRQQAVERLQPFTTQPVQAWPALPAHLQACIDLVLANHVLYYVSDLCGTLSALLRTLATPGLFLTAMGGWDNTLAQFCLPCFDFMGKPFPFHTSEACEAALTSLGETYCTEDVHYRLIFADTEEHRLTMGRFLMGDDFHALPRQTLVQGFDPYVQAGHVSMQIMHRHYLVRH